MRVILLNFLKEICGHPQLWRPRSAHQSNRQPKTLICAVFLSLLGLAWILPTSPALAISRHENLRFGNLTINDGLSQSSLYNIYQDQRGFLWFGTEDGLNRYDGYEFKGRASAVQRQKCRL